MTDQGEEQALLIYIKLADDQFGTSDERELIFQLENILAPIVEEIGAEYDGNEFGQGFAILYIYGSDTEALFDAVIKTIKNSVTVPSGSYAIKRYGGPGAREEKLTI